MGANAVSDRDLRLTGATAATLEGRILEATSRCVARWGVAKTTLDDIAREAGCSRATIYRVLPGGKQALLVSAAHHEIGRALRVLDARLAGCDDLRAVLVTLVSGGAAFVTGNDALRYLVEHEPEIVLPHVSFDGLEPLLHRVAEFSSPHLARFLDADTAWRTGEWMARLVTSYAFDDLATVDLADPGQAAHVVDTYVLPGLRPEAPEPTTHQPPTDLRPAAAGA